MRCAGWISIVLTMLASCTAKEPERTVDEPVPEVPEAPPVEPPEAEPEPPPSLELGPLVGGARPIATPTAGRYALSLRASQDRFLTMEHTLDRSIDGGASLELREDGSVYACFWGTARSGGSISKYASDDGQHHRNEFEDPFRVGMWGTWTAEPEAARASVRFMSVDHRSCERSEAAVEQPSPSVMTCHAIAAGDGLPVAAIVCRPPADQHRMHELAMALADSPRSGPWAIREDPTGRHPRAFGEDVQPWLLLGSPGLLVVARDDREGTPIDVTLTAGDVPTPRGPLEAR